MKSGEIERKSLSGLDPPSESALSLIVAAVSNRTFGKMATPVFPVTALVLP